MTIQELKINTAINTNQSFDEISKCYAELIKSNFKDWKIINDKITDKYGKDSLDVIKHEAWLKVRS